MQYYAVIDTNVLVSAMLRVQSVPGQLVNVALLNPMLLPLKKYLILCIKNEQNVNMRRKQV